MFDISRRALKVSIRMCENLGVGPVPELNSEVPQSCLQYLHTEGVWRRDLGDQFLVALAICAQANRTFELRRHRGTRCCARAG